MVGYAQGIRLQLAVEPLLGLVFGRSPGSLRYRLLRTVLVRMPVSCFGGIGIWVLAVAGEGTCGLRLADRAEC